MSRVFVVHINKSELSNDSDSNLISKVNESYCNYAFTDEDEADDFVEVVTGYNPKNLGIIYGVWTKRIDDNGDTWSIMYDNPYELNPANATMSRDIKLDF